MTRGRVAALLELGAGFHPDLSGRENVYLNASILGMTRAETDARFDDILEFSGIGDFIDTQVKFYSSGMFVRLAFAVAVHTDPDILLVDEVLAVGDEAFQRKCMERIAVPQRGPHDHPGVPLRRAGRGALRSRHRAQGRRGGLRRGRQRRRRRLCATCSRDGASARRRRAEPVKPIEVTRIEVLDAEGRRQGRSRSARRCAMRIHVRAKQAMPEWAIGFSIDTPIGQMVLASNTERLGVDLPGISVGDSAMDFAIESANFGAGQYFVNANVSESSTSTPTCSGREHASRSRATTATSARSRPRSRRPERQLL